MVDGRWHVFLAGSFFLACSDRTLLVSRDAAVADAANAATDASVSHDGGSDGVPDDGGRAALPSVAAGHSFTCALTGSGGIKCWGELNAQLAANSPKPVTWPKATDVTGFASGVTAISTSRFAEGWGCAVMGSGALRCWGDSFSPVAEYPWTAAVITEAADGFCVLTVNGGVECKGTNGPETVPKAGAGIAAFAGDHSGHYCAITTTGGLKCWGSNTEGEVGDGTWENRAEPVDVLGLTSGVAAVSTGYGDTCAVMTTGNVKCWGYNGWGELGDGSGQNQNKPVDVVGLGSKVLAVSTYGQTCAITTMGGVKCWGKNDSGQLGDDSTQNQPRPVGVVGLDSGVASISTGYSHTCAVMKMGGIKCWGSNQYGELGDDSKAESHKPVDVVGF